MTRCKHKTHRQYTDYFGNSLCRRCIHNHPDFWKWKLRWLRQGVIKMGAVT